MKADLPHREPKGVEFWQKERIYEAMVLKRKENPKYILHDGPPYANGHLHMGHALNKILKDIIVKFKSLSGFYTPYVPGWDCHGLPIEHQLMKELGANKHSIDRTEFRRKAKNFALKFVQIQRKEFERLGVFGDWENPYLTLAPHYEAHIIQAFRELLLKGFIYRSLKPVLWCPQCETALAEAEVEYEDKKSPAVFVKFLIDPNKKGGLSLDFSRPNYIVIWTTTPWTLPANVGFMLHPRMEYALTRIKKSNEVWVISKNLLKNLLEQKLKMKEEEYQILEIVTGEKLKGLECKRIFPKSGDLELSRAFLSEEVSAEEGTGIVHCAPGHGDVDYVQGHLAHKLKIVSPVNDAGKFSSEVKNSSLEGQFVLKEGNEAVLKILREQNLLAFQEEIQHSYPHCWRCKKPVIFRATDQWFLNVEKENLRTQLLNIIEQVEWIPDYGKNRIRGMVEMRPDWCLSRQRLWGTPIPIFYCKNCKCPLTDDQAIGMVEEIIGLEGSDIWFKEEASYFLQSQFKCSQCGKEEFYKENDILDVWFDSGISHEAVLKGEGKTFSNALWKEELHWPADLYLEGSDQHRGWFQTSLIPSAALYKKAPYKSVLTHGFIVDGDGKKMSKSLENVIAPEDILKIYGADILRLWVASSDYREDIRISPDILKGVAENYRKIRNTFRYLLGNLSDFNASSESIPYDNLLEIDRWALTRVAALVQAATQAYLNYEFHKGSVAFVEFCVNDCSSFYFDVLKDRLYTYGKNSVERKSAQTVLHAILSSLVSLTAPILSFTSEEVWQLGLEAGHWQGKSVFLRDIPQINSLWRNDALDQKWKKVKEIKNKVNLFLEKARQSGMIGSSLEAKVSFKGGSPEEKSLIKNLGNDLPMIFIASQVDSEELSGEGALEVVVDKAAGTKCLRCWRYDSTVGLHAAQPEICSRCQSSLN